MRRLLSLPVYRRLLGAYMLNEFAWSVGVLALSVLVYRRTGSALGSAGFYLCSQFLPALLAPPLVARLDVVSPRRLLPVLYATEAILFGVLGWLAKHFELAPVLLITVLDGIIAATAAALAVSTRAELLRPLGLLQEGNATTNVGFSISFMSGPVIGGIVVAAGGTIVALLANCVLFSLAALVLAATVLPTGKPQAGSTVERLRAGLRHVRGQPAVRRLLSMQAIALVFLTVTIPVEVVYAQHTLHAGARGYGVLMGFWGGGAVAGSAIYARWRRAPASALIGGSALSVGIGFTVMALAPSLPVALVGAAVAGSGNGIEVVAVSSALQERTDPRWLALTMSLNGSVQQLAPGLGILAGGVIATIASTRVAFAIGALGAFAFAAAVPLLLGPQLRSDAATDSVPGESGPAVPPRESLV